MLLLVLILVLVAFGLLVVALLTGNVLCAWLSVAVSVAAAVVLIVDWWQRRSVEKAGRAGAEVARSTAPPVDTSADLRGSGGDHDPVTEVLPVVAPGGTGAGAATVVTAAPADADDSHGVGSSDAQRTVTMPAVQPSGSAGRPSGAEAVFTPSGGSSSPRVTNSSFVAASEDAQPALGDERRTDSESTMVVDTRKPPFSTDDAPTGGPSLEKGSRPGSDQTGTSGADDRSADVADRVGTAAASVPPNGAQAAVATPADAAAPPARVPAEPSTEAPSDNGSPTVVTRSAAGGESADAVAQAEPPAEVPGDRSRSTFGGPAAASGHELFDPVDRSAAEAPAAAESTAMAGATDTASSDSGEPPEEQYDPAAARVVATLTEQVLVIDEQPRYHVAGCRALAALPTIPLPAREAVELGFTPCGWCTPDAVLGGHHRAGARP